MTLDRAAPLLEIVVDLDQYTLVPELKRVFPDLSPDRWIDGRMYYLASLAEGPESTRQRAFLAEHQLDYLDKTRQCERSIHAFFAGVSLDGLLISWIEVEPVPNANGAHLATVKTTDSEVCLCFPPGWDPPGWQQDYRLRTWLFVYEAVTEEVCASLVGAERCITEPVKRAATPAEMGRWLGAQGYTQAICTTTEPGVYGLYRPGDQ